MITLITYRAGFGQPSFSPFCVKAMWLLQAAGVAWERKDSDDPRKMPNAKLPVIKVGDKMIPDSQNIQAYLESQGADFWHGATPAERAIGHAFMRMAEEHIYFHLVQDRWGNDDVWSVVREEYFSAIPRLLRKPITSMIRKEVVKGIAWQGIGRFHGAERRARLSQDFAAIRDQLGDKPFLLGDQPSLPDFSVAAMLGGIIATPVKTALQQLVVNDAVLASYAARVSEKLSQ